MGGDRGVGIELYNLEVGLFPLLRKFQTEKVQVVLEVLDRV